MKRLNLLTRPFFFSVGGSAAATAASAGMQRVAHPGEPRRQLLRLVGVVAAEQLVAAIARERHRDVLARQLRHEVRRKQRHVGKRLVEMHDQLVEQLFEIRRDRPLAMIGLEQRRHLARIRQLVVGAVVEARC